MKLSWIFGAVLAAAATVPATAQVSIYIGTPPPVVRYERRPAAPGADFFWVEGYWQPVGRRYHWVPGRWERRPFENAYWVHPHYDHYTEGWQYHEGYWAHEDHDNGHWRDRDRDHDHDHR